MNETVFVEQSLALPRSTKKGNIAPCVAKSIALKANNFNFLCSTSLAQNIISKLHLFLHITNYIDFTKLARFLPDPRGAGLHEAFQIWAKLG